MLAQIVLTPAESKKLISKAVAKLNVVRRAMTKGMVVLHPSRSTYFIVEEITGSKPKTNYWVCGVVTPKGMCVEMAMVLGGYTPQNTAPVPGDFRACWVIENGKLAVGEKLSELLNRMSPTDVYTGSPMPVELLKRALKKFRCRFVQLYGQTEAGPTITILYPEDHLLAGSDQQLQKLGSAGKPVISYEVRIVDDQGKDVPVGEVGEIIGRSDAVMKRYWRLPKETAKKLKAGWLHTGDLGKFDENSYVYIVDRKGDMIISGGVNIYPREIEEVLYQHPSVLEASVIGVPDDYWGDAVMAIIVPKKGTNVSGDEIIKFCGDHLASYKKPKSVEFWMELPKSPQGKILKKDIRKRFLNKPH